MKGPSAFRRKTSNIRVMSRHPAIFLYTLLILAVFGAGVARGQEVAAPPSSELQTRVEALLESGPFEVQGAHIAYPNVIYAFYSQRAFRPAWTPARASELRRALKDSEADGLDPRDYHLAILEQLSPAMPAFEILHTDALLRIADHLLYG